MKILVILITILLQGCQGYIIGSSKEDKKLEQSTYYTKVLECEDCEVYTICAPVNKYNVGDTIWYEDVAGCEVVMLKVLHIDK